jgi:hypothetical protein
MGPLSPTQTKQLEELRRAAWLEHAVMFFFVYGHESGKV